MCNIAQFRKVSIQVKNFCSSKWHNCSVEVKNCAIHQRCRPRPSCTHGSKNETFMINVHRGSVCK